jgi:hypothetical protein
MRIDDEFERELELRRRGERQRLDGVRIAIWTLVLVVVLAALLYFAAGLG